jgi:hypothetical protein
VIYYFAECNTGQRTDTGVLQSEDAILALLPSEGVIIYMHQGTRILRLFGISAALLLGGVIAHAQDTTIEAGDSYTGTLSDDAASFNYDLTRTNTPILISVTATDFPPTLGLALSGSQNGSISVSFDGDVGNPLFIPPLPEGTAAQIQVTSTQFPAAGDFSVSAVAVQTAPIGAGETLDGEIGADGLPAFFSFDAQVGKLVTVTATGGGFDTRLKLFAPGAILSTAADNDGGLGYDPEIYQAVLSGSGAGYIEVAPAFAGESGKFQVTLTVTDPPTLDETAPTVIRLGDSRGNSGLTFTGSAGGKAEITVKSVGGDTSDAKIAVYQDGIRLVWDDRYDPEGSGTYQIDTTTDSPVYIIITADTRFDEYKEGQFEVSFKRL